MDDNEGQLHDAFATANLWKPSSFFDDPFTSESTLFTPIQLDVTSIKFEHPYAPKETLDKELRLPDLDDFEFGVLPELESLDLSTDSVDTPLLEEEEDIWRIALESGPARKDISFFTWETFENPSHVEKRTPYITESGPEAFDAALAKDEPNTATVKTIRRQSLLDCLWNLGLGRSSILFSFDPNLRTFVPSLSDARVSGLSLPGSRSIVNQFIQTGGTFLYLRSFVERTFASPTTISARVALATSVSMILSTFEDHLGKHANEIRSLLQLQRLFSKPREILVYIARLVDTLKHSITNEHLSSLLHHRVLELEGGDEDLRRISAEILCRVAKPSLELMSEWIGIQKEPATSAIEERDSFVGLEDNPDIQAPPEYIYRSEMMPRYISPEDGNIIFETGNSLRFLKTHHPEHPLASMEKFGVQPPELEWKFAWQDIEAISAKATAYEESLRKAIQSFSSDSHAAPTSQLPSVANPAFGPTNTTDAPQDYEKYFSETTDLFNQHPQNPHNNPPDTLQTLVTQILTSGPTSHPLFSPPISLTPTLSFQPLLAAQSKLTNATTLRLFFRSHNLRMHLSLQRQYHLLNDGVFSSRLSTSLFSPDLETAERQKGTMRSGVHMGLQLGSRTEWPPASSELRLALMGVLSESFHTSALYLSNRPPSNTSASHNLGRDTSALPGNLSFSIRTLSEPEMSKIMDPDSLYALDFLRLQYIPPTPLNLVISTSSLEKYDTIFKFLLRLLRMLFVVSHLPRTYAPSSIQSSTSPSTYRLFRQEAHHFTTALSTYIFQTGIAEHWTAFENYISSIEQRLAEEDDAGELGTRVTSGLESLKVAHEKCLDGIMFSLLLRRRQRKVMGLLEEVFECVLLFAKVVGRDGGDDDGDKYSVSELYAKLRGKIRVFISVCKGLTGKKGYGKGRGTGEENTLERLGVLLEMNGYYST